MDSDGSSTAISIIEQPRTLLIPTEQTSNAALALAKLAAGSGLCKTRVVADAFFIIMYGYELGIPAMTALRTIHTINNTPVCSGEAMLALIRRSGKVEIKISGSATEATVYMKRRESGEEYKAHWTIERATTAGLTGKDTWKKFPQAFLQWRGVSECGKFLCSDIIGGLYTFEEIAPDLPVDESGEPLTITIPKWYEDERNLHELSERAFTSGYIQNRNSAGEAEIKALIAPKTWENYETGRDCWMDIKALSEAKQEAVKAAATLSSTNDDAPDTNQQPVSDVPPAVDIPRKPGEPAITDNEAVALVTGKAAPTVTAPDSPFAPDSQPSESALKIERGTRALMDKLAADKTHQKTLVLPRREAPPFNPSQAHQTRSVVNINPDDRNV